jgi:hypothetical protein
MGYERRGFRADSGHSYQSIEERARQVRQFLAPELLPTDTLPGEAMFDLLPEKTILTSLGSTPISIGVEDLGGLGGETRFDREAGELRLVISDETYSGLRNDVGRDRFTLFHEIAHLFDHYEQVIRLARIPHQIAALQRVTSDHKPYFDTEWQANSIAAALLAPAGGIEAMIASLGREPTSSEVAAAFLMSGEAARHRLNVFIPRRAELRRVWTTKEVA